MITFFTIIFLIVTFLMSVAILMQSSKSDGLGAGFGALGGTQVFGGRGPADMLKKFTTYTAVLFGTLTIFLAYLHRTSGGALEDNPLLNATQNQQTQPQNNNLQNPVNSNQPAFTVPTDTTSN